jgi:hypothetical protein
MSTDLLTAARAEALFASHISCAAPLDPAEVDQAITAAVRAHGGTRGCAAEVAAEYGDHPETAAARMRWALGVVRSLYQPAAVRRPRPVAAPAPVTLALAPPAGSASIGSAPSAESGPVRGELVAA